MVSEARIYIVSVTSWTTRVNATFTPLFIFYRSLVFLRFIVHIHLQSLSSPLFANLYAFIILPIPKLSPCILTYSFISTSYQHSSRFSRCSRFIVSLLVCLLSAHYISPRPYNILESSSSVYLRFPLSFHPTFFLILIYDCHLLLFFLALSLYNWLKVREERWINDRCALSVTVYIYIFWPSISKV
jgi:hypothetical protein